MAFRGTGLSPFAASGFAPLFGLRREIDRLFDTAFSGDVSGTATRWAPAVDIREDNAEIALDVELPGIKPENVDISIENGVLTISGEKRVERKEGEEGRYHVVERSHGSFMRSFQLPQGIDEGQINANFHDGLLTVRIPKAALPQPRKIQIGTGEQQVSMSASREPETASKGAGQSGSSESATTSGGTRQSRTRSEK
jgi:HSP20 family protein